MDQTTVDLIIEAMENKISELKRSNEDWELIVAKMGKDADDARKILVNKANDVADLNYKLRQYEKREEIEHFIKTLGRRYIARDTNMTWVSIFYVLYPSADEHEYHKRGKAKQAIIDLLRSQELGFDESGTIFRSH